MGFMLRHLRLLPGGNYLTVRLSERDSSHDSFPPLLLPVLRSPRPPFHGTQECLRKVPIRSHPDRSEDRSCQPNRLAKGRRVARRLQLWWLPPGQAQRLLQGW